MLVDKWVDSRINEDDRKAEKQYIVEGYVVSSDRDGLLWLTSFMMVLFGWSVG